MLLTIDTSLFYLINHLPHNVFLDNFFGLFSFIGEAGAVWFLLTFLIFLKYQPQKRWSFVAKIYITGLFSFLLVFILKKIFGRVRPEFVLTNVVLPFGPDHSFSFPSGHALMSFTFAALLMELEKLGRLGKLGVLMLTMLISFSRLYLGYHYPLDVIWGAIIGVVIAKIAVRVLATGK